MLDDFMSALALKPRSKHVSAAAVRPLIFPACAVMSAVASFVDVYQTHTQGMSRYIACLIQLLTYGTFLFFYCKLLFGIGNKRHLIYYNEDERITTAHIFIPTLFLTALSMFFKDYSNVSAYVKFRGAENFSVTGLFLAILAIASIIAVILVYYTAVEGFDYADVSQNFIACSVFCTFAALYALLFFVDIIEYGISLLSVFQYGGAVCYCFGGAFFLNNFQFDPLDDEEDEDEE